MASAGHQKQSEARQRFVRAVNTRVNNALIEIAKIGRLHVERYEYDQSDVDKIMATLNAELDRVRVLLETREIPVERVTVIEK